MINSSLFGEKYNPILFVKFCGLHEKNINPWEDIVKNKEKGDERTCNISHMPGQLNTGQFLRIFFLISSP